MTGSIQYGEGVSAFVTTLNARSMMSYERIHSICSDAFGVPISTGTICNMVKTCAHKLLPFMSVLKAKITDLNLLHSDETGLSVAGKTHWVHSVSSSAYTYLALHKKRGYEAIEAIGILDTYNGVIVHDFWKPYFKCDNATHAMCGAHLLRELVGITDNDASQTWAEDMHLLLENMMHAVHQALDKGKTQLSNTRHVDRLQYSRQIR